MDEWSTPTTSDTPHGPRDGVQELLARLTKAIRDAEDMRNNLLKTAGLSVSEAGLTADRDVVVNGELLVTGATRIEGALDLPAGIIGNDALANPLEDGAIGYSLTAFTVPTSLTSVVTRTIDIPAGFTEASVLGIVSVGAWNGSASPDYLYARASINGTGGATMPVFAAASSYATVTVSAIRSLSGLSGPTLTVSADCYGAAGWGSTVAANIVNIDAIAIFRR